MLFLQQAIVADGGDICIPIWAAIGILSTLCGTIVALYAREKRMTDRLERRFDRLLAKSSGIQDVSDS